jgi:hypothetical protein
MPDPITPPVAQPPAAAPADPPAQPAAPPAAPPAPPETPPEPPPDETITLTSAQLKDRLERAQTADRARWLKEHGFESEEAFKEQMKAAEEAAAAAAEAKRKEMSEIERYKADLEAANKATAEEKAKADAKAREAEDIRLELHLRQECAKRGIVNQDFAIYLINRKLAEMGEDEQLDEGKFLDDLVADESQKSALGLVAPPPQEGAATTVPPQNGPPPPPDGPQGEKSALDMTPEELRADAAKHGINMP